MTFPHQITIRRDLEPTSVDAVFGQATIVDQEVVYAGEAWVQQDEFRMRRLSQGNEELESDALVYLPDGFWGIQENDVLEVNAYPEFTGRITRMTRFTEQFYTRLMVKWLGRPT